ncbi:selenoprotein S [Stigmatopora nigra]
MDDVEIEDVDENGNVLAAEGGQPPNNWSLFLAAGDALSPYGCYLLAALAALLASLVYLAARRRRRGGRASPLSGEDAEAEAAARRREALEASRQRMQLEQDAVAAVFREKQQKAQEEKRRQKIQDWDNVRLGNTLRGGRLPRSDDQDAANAAIRAKTADKKPLRRSEYNPLSGEGGGGSCSWRPGRRGPTSGG